MIRLSLCQEERASTRLIVADIVKISLYCTFRSLSLVFWRPFALENRYFSHKSRFSLLSKYDFYQTGCLGWFRLGFGSSCYVKTLFRRSRRVWKASSLAPSFTIPLSFLAPSLRDSPNFSRFAWKTSSTKLFVPIAVPSQK